MDMKLQNARKNGTAFHAAIFDLDGTLVDTLGDFVAAVNLMLSELNLPAVQACDIERMVGKGSEHLLRCVLAQVCHNTGPEQKEALFLAAMVAYQRHYLDVNGKYSQTYPGVFKGLSALRVAGVPMACLTNKPTAFAQSLLKQKGLNEFFSHVYGGDAFERKKPDPLPLLKTCNALGTEAAHTLMVGDSSNDAVAARAAGCPVVLVTYGYNHGEPAQNVDADGCVDTFIDLPAWISAWFAQQRFFE